MIDRLDKLLFGVIDALLVALLAGMFFMVFGNVVLRYGFNSGIVISEELSRIFFVWLTFLGAVTVFRDREHVGVDTLVQQFGRRGRLVCRVLGDVLILVCCLAFFWGTWLQAGINASMRSPVTGIALIWVNGVGFVTSIGIAAIVIARLARVLTDRMDPAERAALYGGLAGEGAPPVHRPIE